MTIKFQLKDLGWVREVFSYENGHIQLYVNSSCFDSVSPHFGAVFSRFSSFGLLLVCKLYSRQSSWQIVLFIETLLELYFLSLNYFWAFLKSHYLCSGNLREKSKFWFIQEPWIYFLVKNQNSQIFYITNIMTHSQFSQEIYFYLLVASLYLIRS